MIQTIKDFLFPYSDYKLERVYNKKIGITKMVEDKRFSGGNPGFDPIDWKEVKTGTFYAQKVEVWVAYHKKTGLPKRKEIFV